MSMIDIIDKLVQEAIGRANKHLSNATAVTSAEFKPLPLTRDDFWDITTPNEPCPWLVNYKP